MARVPFAFGLTGGSTKYGTFFGKADAVFTNSVQNLILGAIDGATKVPADFGFAIPVATVVYKILKIVVQSPLSTDSASLVMHNGSTTIDPILKLWTGNGTFDFPDGITVPANWVPALEDNSASSLHVFTGYIDWVASGSRT